MFIGSKEYFNILTDVGDWFFQELPSDYIWSAFVIQVSHVDSQGCGITSFWIPKQGFVVTEALFESVSWTSDVFSNAAVALAASVDIDVANSTVVGADIGDIISGTVGAGVCQHQLCH